MSNENLVTVYTSPTCQYCKHAIVELENLGIDFVEIDIIEDSSARMSILKKGVVGLPAIKFNDVMFKSVSQLLDYKRGFGAI